MTQKNEYYNNLVKLARTNSIYHQNLLYKEALYLIQPIIYKYKNYAIKFGISRNDLQDLMNETFLKLLLEKIDFYENFSSYYRRKYEFDILRLFKTYKTKKSLVLKEALTTSYFKNRNNEMNLQNSSVEEISYSEKIFDERNFALERLKDLHHIEEVEMNIFQYYLKGFKINEIATIFKISEYKIRNSILDTARKLAKLDFFNEESENINLS